jgi:hypothetical protein
MSCVCIPARNFCAINQQTFAAEPHTDWKKIPYNAREKQHFACSNGFFRVSMKGLLVRSSAAPATDPLGV